MSATRSRRFYVASGIALAVLVALGLVCLLKAERKPGAAKAETTRVPEKHWSAVVSSSKPLRIEKPAPPFPRGRAVPDRNRIKDIGPALFSWGGEDLLKQRGSTYGYNSTVYGATLDQGAVQFTIRDRKEGHAGLGLRFEELRVGGEVLATGGAVPPSTWPEDRVVSYERGSVQEFYVLRPEALEQGYVVTELPAARGPITVTAKVSTKLAGPESPEPQETVTFKRAGKDVITISRAYAVDGQDRRLALRMSYDGDALRMTVPADWVANATLPIVIDPLIGSVITVDSSAAWPESERTCDVAYSPTDQNWLVVWNELFGGNFNWDVYGQLVSRTGSLVGGPIDISASANGDRGLAVSYAPAPVNRFLVVWTHDPNNDMHTSDYRINGRVLNGNGSFVTAPFTVDDPARFDCQPNVAFDGTNWLVVWTNINDSTWTNADILARFVSTAGVPGTSVNIDVDSDWASNASVDFASGTYCVTWSKGNSFSCAARTWNTSGSPLTPLTIVAGSNAKQMDVSAGGGKFLFVWRGDNPAQVNARISNSSLVFDGPAFLVKNGWADQVRAAYSSIDSQWFIINNENPGEVRGRKCALNGTLGTVDQITSNSLDEYDPEIAWNSQDNEMMVVYRAGSAPNYMIQGQRYQMSTPPPPPQVPDPPTDLVGFSAGTSVNLSWQGSIGATSYNIMRSSSTGGPYSAVPGGTGVTLTSFTDGGLSVGTFYYVVTATNAGGQSGNSNETWATVLAVPTGLIASGQDGAVNLSWSAVQNASEYWVYRAESAGGPFAYLDTAFSTAYRDVLISNGTTYFYYVQAANGTGDHSANSITISATPSVGGVTSVLFVVGIVPIPSGSPDAIIAARLSNLGYTLVVKPDNGAQGATAADASGKVLVLLSGTVTPTNLTNPDGTNKFKAVAVPVMSLNAGTYSSLGMTGPTLNTDYGTSSGQSTVQVWNYSDPIIRGLTTLPQPVGVVSGTDTFNWGWPGNFASIGASLQSGKATIFSFIPGDPMPGLSSGAPSKRIGFFVSSSTASALNATGQSLFDAAIQWAAGAPSQPQAVWASIANGQVTFYWEDVAGATSYQLQWSTSPTGPFTLITGVTGTSYTLTNLSNGVPVYIKVSAYNGLGHGADSVLISASPAVARCSVGAIKGSRYIRRRLTGDAWDYWNSREFSATVFMDGQAVSPSLVLPAQGQNAWTIASGPALVSTNPVQSSTFCKVVATDVPSNARGQATLTYSIKVNVGTPQAPVYEVVPPVQCVIDVVPRWTIFLRLHFPADLPTRRTQWVNYPNLFAGDAADTGSVRKTERIRFATDLLNEVNVANLWTQGTLEFYSVNDISNDLSEMIGPGKDFWFGSSLVVTSTEGGLVLESAERLKVLNDTINKPGVVNVYFVHSMTNGVQGITSSNYRVFPGSGIKNPVIVVSDQPTLVKAGQVLAHELGHVLGLKHSDDPTNNLFKPIKGNINNMGRIAAFPSPYYLMHSGNDMIDTLISEEQAADAREIADEALQWTGRIVGPRD